MSLFRTQLVVLIMVILTHPYANAQDVMGMMTDSSSSSVTYVLPPEDSRTTIWFNGSIGVPLFYEINYYDYNDSLIGQIWQWSYSSAVQYRTGSRFSMQFDFINVITRFSLPNADGSERMFSYENIIVGLGVSLQTTTHAPVAIEVSTGVDMQFSGDYGIERYPLTPRMTAALRYQPLENPLRLRMTGGVVHGGLSLILGIGFAP